LYQCECGTEKEFAISKVRRGFPTSCGCIQRIQIKAGDKYGYLTAVEPYTGSEYSDGKPRWIFQCDCGTRKPLSLYDVVSKKGKRATQSCGGLGHPEKGIRVGGGSIAAGRECEFITPAGDIVKMKNLRELIRQYKHLFDPADLAANIGKCVAYYALSDLGWVRPTGHLQEHWKGWRIPEERKELLREQYKKEKGITEFEQDVTEAGPDHFNGQYWEFIGPNGVRLEGFNLHELVRTHPHLFDPQDLNWDKNNGCRAANGLRTLFSLNVAGKPKLKSWKGWTVGARMARELALKQERYLKVLQEQRERHQSN
jgi:hypothetical protein